MNNPEATDPETYVKENREQLVEILKHGNDEFVRALILAALIEFGDDPDIEAVRQELDRIDSLEGSA